MSVMPTAQPFTRDDLKNAKIRLLRDGRSANACVSCVTIDGLDWTLKDFAGRSWWVRTFLVPFLLGHEYRILSRLKGIEGIANDAFMLDRNALAIRFLPGRPLSTLKPEEVSSAFTRGGASGHSGNGQLVGLSSRAAAFD